MTSPLTMDAVVRKHLGRRSFELALFGASDEAIADQLGVTPELVVACREEYDTVSEVPGQEDSRKLAIARAEAHQAELHKWQQRLDVAYQIGLIDVHSAVRAATSLVKSRLAVDARYAKYQDLDSPLRIEMTQQDSPASIDEEVKRLAEKLGMTA